MSVKRIMCRISQRYAANQMHKAEIAAEKADAVFIKEHPEYLERRKKVEEYFKNIENINPEDISIPVRNPRIIADWSIDNVINICDEDPAKIHKLAGGYGLSYYTHEPANKYVSKSDDIITEIPYETGYSISQTFWNFVIHNQLEYDGALTSRFGDIGKSLQENCKVIDITRKFYSR